MNQEIKQKIEEEQIVLLNELSAANLSEEEYTVRMKHLKDLNAMRLEQEKIENEEADKLAKIEVEKIKIENDEYAKDQQRRDESKARKVKYVLELLGIGIPIVAYSYWTGKTLNFEYKEHGIVPASRLKDISGFFKSKK